MLKNAGTVALLVRELWVRGFCSFERVIASVVIGPLASRPAVDQHRRYRRCTGRHLPVVAGVSSGRSGCPPVVASLVVISRSSAGVQAAPLLVASSGHGVVGVHAMTWAWRHSWCELESSGVATAVCRCRPRNQRA